MKDISEDNKEKSEAFSVANYMNLQLSSTIIFLSIIYNPKEKFSYHKANIELSTLNTGVNVIIIFFSYAFANQCNNDT